MTGRDRDTGGRARNSRPRDRYGRPLERDAPGVPTMPDDLDGDPVTALPLAQRLLDEDRPFHAHEVLEAVWKAAPAAERPLWRALAQVAVGVTHVRRGNPNGAHALLDRAAATLEPFTDAPVHGVDVAGVLAEVRRLLALTDPPDDVPVRLRLT